MQKEMQIDESNMKFEVIIDFQAKGICSLRSATRIFEQPAKQFSFGCLRSPYCRMAFLPSQMDLSNDITHAASPCFTAVKL